MLNSDKICKKCLYPSNHPLGISFDSKGLCSGCVVHEEKDNYDWQKAFEELKTLTQYYQNDAHYDCVVPVSGAKDSYYIVHIVKNILKLNPLLVSYNRHYNTALGISQLERLRTVFGCDIVTSTMAPSKLKKITQQTLPLMGSIHWAYLAGSTVFPVQVAVKRKIPLIIWGAHQGVDQVGMFFHADQAEMTRRYRKEHDLLGWEAEDLVDKAEGLSEQLLAPLFYPTDKMLNQIGVRGIYLNHYLYWDSKRQHEEMIKCYNYRPQVLARTFDTYQDSDCQYYMDVHDLIKQLKFGFSKVVDQACREIRFGRLTRTNAVKLVAYFQNQPIKNLKSLTQWLEISESKFYEYLKPFAVKKAIDTTLISFEEIQEILSSLDFKTQTNDLFWHSQLLMRGGADEKLPADLCHH